MQPFVAALGVVTLALRLATGLALIAAAGSCRLPDAVLGLGVLFVAIALASPLVGLERVRAFARRFQARGDASARGWSVTAAAFGALLLFAA